MKPGAAVLPAGTIQRLFGRHDITDVKSQVDGPATEAAHRLGADAYATGRSVGFRGEPDVHPGRIEHARSSPRRLLQSRG